MKDQAALGPIDGAETVVDEPERPGAETIASDPPAAATVASDPPEMATVASDPRAAAMVATDPPAVSDSPDTFLSLLTDVRGVA